MTGFVPCPYPGLRPFLASEADVFFGRDEYIDRLFDRLAEDRFLTIAGPSGCGKTSLVEAGLIPGLEGGILQTEVSGWRIERVRPGTQPLKRLAQVFLDLYRITAAAYAEEGSDLEDLRQELRRAPEFLPAMLDQAADRAPRKVENILLVIDRFEELFYRSRPENEEEVRAFISLLLALPRRPCKVPLYVTIIMRSEFLGDCNAFVELPEQINRSLLLVPGLSDGQYELAIEEPARSFGGDVDDQLVNQLLHDLRRRRDPLPLLQHALAAMWHVATGVPTSNDQSRTAAPSDIRLSLDHYRSIGGLVDPLKGTNGLVACLTQTLDECLTELEPEERRIAEVMFLALADYREIRIDSQHRVSLAHIAAEAGVAHERVLAVLKPFRRSAHSFLVARSGAPLSPADTVEVSHESLFRIWAKCDEWRSRIRIAQGASLSEPKLLRECDVFLSYHSADRAEVVEIARDLKRRGVDVWLDFWEIPPGSVWQPIIDQQIGNARTAAIFFGEKAGPIQLEEGQALVVESTDRACPVIPVILKTFKGDLPRLLRNRTYVDFRKPSVDPMGQLIWGITGKRPTVQDAQEHMEPPLPSRE